MFNRYHLLFVLSLYSPTAYSAFEPIYTWWSRLSCETRSIICAATTCAVWQTCNWSWSRWKEQRKKQKYVTIEHYKTVSSRLAHLEAEKTVLVPLINNDELTRVTESYYKILSESYLFNVGLELKGVHYRLAAQDVKNAANSSAIEKINELKIASRLGALESRMDVHDAIVDGPLNDQLEILKLAFYKNRRAINNLKKWKIPSRLSDHHEKIQRNTESLCDLYVSNDSMVRFVNGARGLTLDHLIHRIEVANHVFDRIEMVSERIEVLERNQKPNHVKKRKRKKNLRGQRQLSCPIQSYLQKESTKLECIELSIND